MISSSILSQQMFIPYPQLPRDVTFRWIELWPHPIGAEKLWPRVRVTIVDWLDAEAHESFVEWSMETGEPICGKYARPADAERLGKYVDQALKWAGYEYAKWVAGGRP